MKVLIFINLIMALLSSQVKAQNIFYKNGRTAWNGAVAYYANGKIAWNNGVAYHDNGKIAWNNGVAYHDNGKIAWNNGVAYHDNGKIAWNNAVAYHDNGKIAWNNGVAYDDNGRILASNLYAQIQGAQLDGLQLGELKLSDKIQLLNKILNKRAYVVGVKMQLSEKNAILVNREKRLTTNFSRLNRNIQFEVLNKKTKLTILGQTVVDQR